MPLQVVVISHFAPALRSPGLFVFVPSFIIVFGGQHPDVMHDVCQELLASLYLETLSCIMGDSLGMDLTLS